MLNIAAYMKSGQLTPDHRKFFDQISEINLGLDTELRKQISAINLSKDIKTGGQDFFSTAPEFLNFYYNHFIIIVSHIQSAILSTIQWLNTELKKAKYYYYIGTGSKRSIRQKVTVHNPFCVMSFVKNEMDGVLDSFERMQAILTGQNKEQMDKIVNDCKEIIRINKENYKLIEKIKKNITILT